jgi:hypothetical protein
MEEVDGYPAFQIIRVVFESLISPFCLALLLNA